MRQVTWKPELWKPLHIKHDPDWETRYLEPEVKSFYEYQDPSKAYEVKGIRPNAARIFRDRDEL